MTATVERKTRPVIADGVMLTYEEYLATPEIMARYEIVDGVVSLWPTPTPSYQLLLMEIATLLDQHIKAHRLGFIIPAPTDMVLCKAPKLEVRQPDVSFFSLSRLGIASTRELETMPQIEIAPHLAVEILTASRTRDHLTSKLTSYAKFGVNEVWAVSREASTVEVLALQNGQYVRAGLYGTGDTIASTVLPGLALAVDAIFA